LMLCLAAVTGMIGDMTVKPAAMRQALENGFPTATDLADWLVREAGLPFREAHHVTGRVVRLAEEKGVRLDKLSLADLTGIDERLNGQALSVLSVEASLRSRSSFGGTAPLRVRESVMAARERFL
ncbi:MAG: argininosuccinate lyase, partial [Pseudomonadota bacterium]